MRRCHHAWRWLGRPSMPPRRRRVSPGPWTRIVPNDAWCGVGAAASARGCRHTCVQGSVGALGAASKAARARRRRAALRERLKPRTNSQGSGPSPKKSQEFVQAVKRAAAAACHPGAGSDAAACRPSWACPPQSLTRPWDLRRAQRRAVLRSCRSERVQRFNTCVQGSVGAFGAASTARARRRCAALQQRRQVPWGPRCWTSASRLGQTPCLQDPLRRAWSLSKQSSTPLQRHASLGTRPCPPCGLTGPCVAQWCRNERERAAATPACRGRRARLGRRRKRREQGAAAPRCSSDDWCPQAAGRAPHAKDKLPASRTLSLEEPGVCPNSFARRSNSSQPGLARTPNACVPAPPHNHLCRAQRRAVWRWGRYSRLRPHLQFGGAFGSASRATRPTLRLPWRGNECPGPSLLRERPGQTPSLQDPPPKTLEFVQVGKRAAAAACHPGAGSDAHRAAPPLQSLTSAWDLRGAQRRAARRPCRSERARQFPHLRAGFGGRIWGGVESGVSKAPLRRAAAATTGAPKPPPLRERLTPWTNFQPPEPSPKGRAWSLSKKSERAAAGACRPGRHRRQTRAPCLPHGLTWLRGAWRRCRVERARLPAGVHAGVGGRVWVGVESGANKSPPRRQRPPWSLLLRGCNECPGRRFCAGAHAPDTAAT